jgi:hypothetical protein
MLMLGKTVLKSVDFRSKNDDFEPFWAVNGIAAV